MSKELGFMGEALEQLKHSGELEVIHQKSIEQVSQVYVPEATKISTLFLLPDNPIVADPNQACEVEGVIFSAQSKEPDWKKETCWDGYEEGSIKARWRDYHLLNRSRYRASFHKEASTITPYELQALTSLVESDSGLLALKKIQLWCRDGVVDAPLYLGKLPNTEPVKRFFRRMFPMNRFLTPECMSAHQHRTAAQMRWCSLSVNTAFWCLGNQR